MSGVTHAPSARRRLRFWFDRMMARGSGPLMALLALVVLVLIAVCALIILIGGIKNQEDKKIGFVEGGWSALMRTFDAGTMGGDAGWSLRGVGLIATIGGIFIVSALIGVITTGLDGRLEALRRGRGAVELSGHTLILGWSSNVEAIVSELAEANSNQKRSAVVVLADFPKDAMDEALETVAGINKRMLTLTRTGSTASPEHLKAVGVERAKSVVVVSNTESADADPDAVRTALAVLNATGYEGHVVVELKRRTLADSLRTVSKGRALAVTGPEVIAQVTAEVCRYHGMSAVYQELLDFDGDEIYFHEEPSLVGVPFGDVVQAFETSSILGLRRADGTIDLAPPLDASGRRRRPADRRQRGRRHRDRQPRLPARARSPRCRGTTSASRARSCCSAGTRWRCRCCTNWIGACRRAPGSWSAHPNPPSASVRLSRCELVVREGDLQDYDLLRDLAFERAYNNIAILCGRVRSVADDDSRNLLTLLSLREIVVVGRAARASMPSSSPSCAMPPTSRSPAARPPTTSSSATVWWRCCCRSSRRTTS